MIGRRFGRLVVLQLDKEQTEKNKGHAKSYLCQCDCGNTKTVRKSNLLNGQTTSCGCIVKENGKKRCLEKVIDLVGQRFGRLLITRRKENDPNDPIKQRRYGAWWYADCDCGAKDVIVKGTYLRAGRIQSCGCYNKIASHKKNTIDLTGGKYGMLTVIHEATNQDGTPMISPSGSSMWECICDCGNHAIVSSNALRTGDTCSCGCLSSKNEMIIKRHLEDIGIKYQDQYYFDDLRSPITNWLLKFDIAVFDNYNNLSLLIEYDGEQHDQEMRYSKDEEKNKEKLIRIQLYDKLKNEYCIIHNIDLLRINYREKDRLIEIIDSRLKQKGLI